MSASPSPSGDQLYRLLPEVYRYRDGGDLGAYLDAAGYLLDLVRNTLDQRHADSFPDNPPEGPACQDWLLPYFAQLLDARLVSPHVEGRRDEVANAIHWRQRKGTLTAIEEIAEAVAQVEVEIQEGWKRVATTPRIGLPLLPAVVFGEAEEPDPVDYLAMARHPGLPAAMVDLRTPSRAIEAEPGNPAVHRTDFGGQRYFWPRDDASGSGRERNPTLWRQWNLHGVPCFPGSYEDLSPRTVDVRSPNWRQGHYHPKRVLLFAPPPAGLFPRDPAGFAWTEAGPDGPPDVIERVEGPGDLLSYRNATEKSAEIAGVVLLEQTIPYRFEKLRFTDEIKVTEGRLELRRVAAAKVVIESEGGDQPLLNAVDCVFGSIEVKKGLVRLEYCTVLDDCECKNLHASDCVFDGAILGVDLENVDLCVRFSRIPPDFAETLPELIHNNDTITNPAAFLTTDRAVFWAEDFGAPGCAVLHPATPESIAAGAEDGGEMGAYHAWRYVAAAAAVIDKLNDFLPVGIGVALIPDKRLLCKPPTPVD